MDKREKIARAIRLVWLSLESHLEDTYDPTYPKLKSKLAKECVGDKNFHRKCVKEYGEIIKTLTELI